MDKRFTSPLIWSFLRSLSILSQMLLQQICIHLLHISQHTLREKPYFPSPTISWKAQKDQVNIIFSSIFWLKKRPYFPSPRRSKQELHINQYISSFHQLLDSKKDRISHHRKVQNKNFSIISKYYLSINFLALKKTVFPIPEKIKTRTFQ